jgi:hypothetical protein
VVAVRLAAALAVRVWVLKRCTAKQEVVVCRKSSSSSRDDTVLVPAVCVHVQVNGCRYQYSACWWHCWSCSADTRKQLLCCEGVLPRTSPAFCVRQPRFAQSTSMSWGERWSSLLPRTDLVSLRAKTEVGCMCQLHDSASLIDQFSGMISHLIFLQTSPLQHGGEVEVDTVSAGVMNDRAKLIGMSMDV